MVCIFFHIPYLIDVIVCLGYFPYQSDIISFHILSIFEHINNLILFIRMFVFQGIIMFVFQIFVHMQGIEL